MTLDTFLTLVWVGALGLGVMVIAAAIVEAVGRRRLADALRLDLGPDEAPDVCGHCGAERPLANYAYDRGRRTTRLCIACRSSLTAMGMALHDRRVSGLPGRRIADLAAAGLGVGSASRDTGAPPEAFGTGTRARSSASLHGAGGALSPQGIAGDLTPPS